MPPAALAPPAPSRPRAALRRRGCRYGRRPALSVACRSLAQMLRLSPRTWQLPGLPPVRAMCHSRASFLPLTRATRSCRQPVRAPLRRSRPRRVLCGRRAQAHLSRPALPHPCPAPLPCPLPTPSAGPSPRAPITLHSSPVATLAIPLPVPAPVTQGMPRLHPSPSTRSTTGARARLICLGQLHRYRRACCCPVLTCKTSSLGRGEAITAESMCTICRLSARCRALLCGTIEILLCFKLGGVMEMTSANSDGLRAVCGIKSIHELPPVLGFLRIRVSTN